MVTIVVPPIPLAVTKPVKFSPLTGVIHLTQRNVSLFTHILKLIHLGLFVLNKLIHEKFLFHVSGFLYRTVQIPVDRGHMTEAVC